MRDACCSAPVNSMAQPDEDVALGVFVSECSASGSDIKQVSELWGRGRVVDDGVCTEQQAWIDLRASCMGSS